MSTPYITHSLNPADGERPFFYKIKFNRHNPNNRTTMGAKSAAIAVIAGAAGVRHLPATHLHLCGASILHSHSNTFICATKLGFKRLFAKPDTFRLFVMVAPGLGLHGCQPSQCAVQPQGRLSPCRPHLKPQDGAQIRSWPQDACRCRRRWPCWRLCC